MRIQILLLLLAYAVPSSMALRGERRLVSSNHYGRTLKGEEAPKEDPKAKDDPKKKEDSKKEDPKKKEDKKKCKKAKKHDEEKKSGGSRKMRGRRQIQEVTEDEDAPYCLHGALSEEQCTDLENAPKEGSVLSDLSFQILHSNDEDADTILADVHDILFGDTAPRYVGCKDMKAAPKGKSKGKDPEERFLQELHDEEEEWVDVTSVVFNSLDLVPNGCKNTEVPDGSSCDVVQSDVEIFYQGLSDPTEEEVDDMKNLLIETILSQSSAGSFAPIGAIDSVEVDGIVVSGISTSATNGTDTDGDQDQERENPLGDSNAEEEESGGGFMKFVLAAIAAIVVFGIAYWYGTSGEDEDFKSEKDRDTSDSEDDQPNNNNNNTGFLGGWVTSEEPAEETKQSNKATTTAAKKESSTTPQAKTTSSKTVQPNKTTATSNAKPKTTTSSPKKEEPKQEEGWVDSMFGALWAE